MAGSYNTSYTDDDILGASLADLMDASDAHARAGHGRLVTYSRKVFIPLTHLCRDTCRYCTFAEKPKPGARAYLTPEEALAIARRGRAAGCKEALFTLGDQPERRWDEARRTLEEMGFASTLDYLGHVAARVFDETGLLPHLNPGVMSRDAIKALRPHAPSMGLMYETGSERLSRRGGPHFGCPDKEPAVRRAVIEAAGLERVPFTTGLLIGIGETPAERLSSLRELKGLHDRHGHLQEIIIQPFRPKPGTRMETTAPAPRDDLLWTLAAARLIFGPAMSIQTPPNLSAGDMRALIRAGVNDWGGVSPVTPDFVNPEAPWPHLDRLAAGTARAGATLAERLTIYPHYVKDTENWVDPRLRTSVIRMSDSDGLARDCVWSPGAQAKTPAPPKAPPGWRPSTRLAGILKAARDGRRLSETDIAELVSARGGDAALVCAAADALRRDVCGDTVSFVINRNINYTNICTYRCGFCAFAKGRVRDASRDAPYLLDTDEIGRRAAEAWSRGATEVCLQGGIHPTFNAETYLGIVKAVKAAAPDIHVHAFSPLEITQGARRSGISVETLLEALAAEGLASLPGTAAEILDDDVRHIICPDKLNTEEWLAVMRTAHDIGLSTTSTIMFGHVERPLHIARHLLRLRNLQAETGGFTEFVPLPFVPMEAPIYQKGAARAGPSYREALIIHAVARLALHPVFKNIQASWVKLGPDGARDALAAGVNDLGGTLMNESISRAAGAKHGQEFDHLRMIDLIQSAGRHPQQRTTLYRPAQSVRRIVLAP